MHWDKYSLLALLSILMISVSGFGSCAGYTVSGAPQGGAISADSPNALNIFSWAWDSVNFLFNMCTFQVDNMPVWISSIFLVMALLAILLLVSLIRGN